ncbi:Putative transmembrane protein (PGPGW) [Sphingomonas rubra]|uniref:Putative transmembrane protein (PGPGW) n=2 Tax=Sphingomonas rubra TaxID=634430 RepID=A0A1I5QY20_9SPHN|nr:Putative transmembrane protein (PGPGW) [Sphingomonas rubra]
MRLGQLSAGTLLILLAPLTAPLPGPGATVMFVAGLVLVLRNSAWARRRFVRAKRRWPRAGALADRLMRRGSALRRRARAALPR